MELRMIFRRNLICSLGATFLGVNAYNIIKPAIAARPYKIEEENICNSEDFIINHEPINDVTEQQIREDLIKIIPDYMIPSVFYFEKNLPKNQLSVSEKKVPYTFTREILYTDLKRNLNQAV